MVYVSCSSLKNTSANFIKCDHYSYSFLQSPLYVTFLPPCLSTELAIFACVDLWFYLQSSFMARAPHVFSLISLSQSPHFNWTTILPLHLALVYVTLISLICGNVPKYSCTTLYRHCRDFGNYAHPFGHDYCHMFVSVHVKVSLAHQMNGFLRTQI